MHTARASCEIAPLAGGGLSPPSSIWEGAVQFSWRGGGSGNPRTGIERGGSPPPELLLGCRVF